MTDPKVALLDTNVFIHAHANDSHTAECAQFLAALASGTVEAHLEPIVVHELTYALPHFVKGMTRQQIGAYVGMILSWPGVQGDKHLIADAVRRWVLTPGLGFVDAYLAVLALRRGCAVYTKNVRHLTGQGVAVPRTLPSSPLP